MADTPSSGNNGTTANLGIGVTATGADAAVQKLDSVVKATNQTVEANVRLADSIRATARARLTEADVYARASDAVRKQIDAARALQQQEMGSTKTLSDLDEQGQRYVQSLAEQAAMYGKTTAEIQRYKAAQMNVIDLAEPYIASMEVQTKSMNALEYAAFRAMEQNELLYLRSTAAAEYSALRTMEANESVFLKKEAQRVADEAALEKQVAAEIAAANAVAIAKEKAALRQMEANERVFLDQQARLLKETEAAEYAAFRQMEANEAVYLRKLEKEKAAEALAEKQALAEARWANMSVKQQIAELEKLKAYKAAGVSEAKITDVFSPSALANLGKLDQMTQAYNATLGGHSKKLGEVTEATSVWDKMMGNARVRAEGIVLVHEAMQGRFTKLAGSLGVMAEYLQSAAVQMTGLGIVALGVVGTLGLMAYEMVRGIEQQKEFSNAIARTNDYAGVTKAGLDNLAHSVGTLHGNYTEAYHAAAELTRSGKFTAEQITMITGAVVDLDHAFGTKVNVSIKEFESLSVQGTGNAARGTLQVSKALEKLDEQYHFVNASLMEEVIHLEQEGKAREASQLGMTAYAKEAERASKESADNIGWIETAWNKVLKEIKGVTQAMADVGKVNLVNDKAKAFADTVKNSQGGVETDRSKLSPMGVGFLNDYIKASEKLAIVEKASAERAEKARIQSEADHVLTTRAIADKTLMAKSYGALYDAVAKFHEENAIIEKAQPGYIEKNMDYLIEREDAIFKAHSEKEKKVAKEKDDGRKSERDRLVADLQSRYNITKEYADADIKLAKTQADEGVISRGVQLDRTQADYDRELFALQKLKDAEVLVFQKYANRTDAESAATAKSLADKINKYNEAQVKIRALATQAQEDITKTAVKEGTKDENAEVKTLTEKIQKQKEYNSEIGKTAEEKELARLALSKEQDAIDQQAITRNEAILAEWELNAVEVKTYEARIEKLKEAIKLRADYNGLLTTGAALEAMSAQQKEVDKQYKQFTDKLQNDLASAIVDGGGVGIKKLIRDMELSFAKAILRPILQPISDGVASFLYPNATQAGGVAGAAGAGGAGGAIGLANAAANAYKALSGGFSSIGSTVTNYAQQGINMLGPNTGMYTGVPTSGIGPSALAEGAGSVAQVGAGIYAGIKIGSVISGDYGSRSTVNAGTGIGAIVGAIGGPLGSAIGAAIGGSIGGVLNRAFGMGSKNVTGIGMSGNLSDSGVNGTNYSNWHQDGGWFRSDKNGTDKTPLDSSVVNSFTSGFAAMKTTTQDLAKSVGITTANLTGYTKDFNIALSSTDTAANQKAITDFFTTVGDEMAGRLIPNLSQFAKSGESASVTLQRLSDNFKATDSLAMSLGRTAKQMFQGTGLDTAMSRDRVVTALGGTSNAATLASSYASNFLTEAQKLAPALSAVNDAMAGLGYTGIDTREKFAGLVNTLVDSGAVMTDAGAKQFADLMNLSSAFATTHAASVDLTKSVQQVADESKALQDQYNQLVLTTTALRAKERLTISDENKALYDQVKARGDLATAYKTESDALKATIANTKAFRATLATFRDSLNTGSLSGNTPLAQLAETQRQYNDMLAKAKAGDQTAMNGLTNAATAYLTADQAVKASSDAYMQDKASVLQQLSDLSNYLGSGQTDAELQLAAMDKSVAQLININEGVLTVADLLAKIAGLPSAGNNAPLARQITSVPVVTQDSLAQAIAPVVSQIQALRDEQASQTGDLIVSNTEAIAQSTQQLAQTQQDTVKSSNWKIAQMQDSQVQ